jgi:hypothetical protein
MFGLFAKNTLSLSQRAELMLTIVAASLMAYVKHRKWLTTDLRVQVVENWFARYGGSASAVFRAKVMSAADELARHLVATLEESDLRELWQLLERGQSFNRGEDSSVDREVASLLVECEKALVAKGLAS